MKTDDILINYLKELSAEDVGKGFALFADRMNEIVTENKHRKQYFINVPGEGGNGNYIVTFRVLANYVDDNCDCKAYEKYAECKHTVAAALHILTKEFSYNPETLEELIAEEDDDINELAELIDMDYMEEELNFTHGKNAQKNNAKVIKLDVAATANTEWKKFEMKGGISQNELQNLCGYYWTDTHYVFKLALINFDEKALHWKFHYKENKNLIYSPEIKYDAHETYYYRCTCNHRSRYPMCKHVRTAFDALGYKNDKNYFLQFRDWTDAKNKLLQPYGLTIADEESKAFKFTISYYGELQMQAPSSYIREGDKEQLKKLNKVLKPKNITAIDIVSRPNPLPDTIIDFETGFVLNLNSQRLKIGFELETAKVYHKQNKTDLKKLSINQSTNLPLLKELSDQVYSLLMQLSDAHLLDYLQTQGQNYLKNYSNTWEQMTESTSVILKNHYIACLQKLWSYLSEHPDMFLLKEGKFSSSNCKPVKLSNEAVELSFQVTTDERFITIRQIPVINNKPVSPGDVKLMHGFIFSINNVLHIIKNLEDLPVLEQFRNDFIKVAMASKYEAIQNIISPLQEGYPVELPDGFDIKTIKVTPHSQVLLKEFNNQYMMLQPQFIYEGEEIDYSNNPEDILITLADGSVQLIKRDVAFEKQFFESLRSLHDVFSRQRQNDFFYVHFNEVMKGNWFLNTVRYLQENNITVKGMQELKRFRYNTNKPKWEMKTAVVLIGLI